MNSVTQEVRVTPWATRVTAVRGLQRQGSWAVSLENRVRSCQKYFCVRSLSACVRASAPPRHRYLQVLEAAPLWGTALSASTLSTTSAGACGCKSPRRGGILTPHSSPASGVRCRAFSGAAVTAASLRTFQ